MGEITIRQAHGGERGVGRGRRAAGCAGAEYGRNEGNWSADGGGCESCGRDENDRGAWIENGTDWIRSGIGSGVGAGQIAGDVVVRSESGVARCVCGDHGGIGAGGVAGVLDSRAESSASGSSGGAEGRVRKEELKSRTAER